MFHQVPTGEFLFKKIQGGHFFCLEMTTTFDDWESLQEAGGKKVRSDVLIRKIQERNATSRTWKTWIYCQWWTLKETTIPKKCGIFLPHILNFPAKFADVLYVQSMGMQGTPGWWRGRGGRRWRGRESTSRWGLVEHHRLNEMEVFWGLGMFSMKWIELHWNGKNMKVLAQIKQTLLLETDQVTDMKKLVNTWFGTRLNILETGVREVTPWILFSAKGSEKKTGVDFRRTKSKPLKQRWRKWKRTCLLDTSFGGELRLNLWQLLAFPWERWGDLTHGNCVFSFSRLELLTWTSHQESNQSWTHNLNLFHISPLFLLIFQRLWTNLCFFFLGFIITLICKPQKTHPPFWWTQPLGGPIFFSDRPPSTSALSDVEKGAHRMWH